MSRYGMTIPLPGVPLHAQRDLVEELVALGYTDLWTQETGGLDAFTPLALASVWLRWSEKRWVSLRLRQSQGTHSKLSPPIR